jgi:subtilase family serine protease
LAIFVAPASVSAASSSQDPEMALPGNTVAGLNPASRVAGEDAGRIIDLQLALKLRNRAQLDDLIRRVSTPHSTEYGHYLTPQEFGARFGPTAMQVDQATALLRAHGFRVTAAAPGSTLVDARGTVAAVEAALHTRIGHYREASGHEFFANDTAPALPSSLAANITGVLGLDNRYQRRHSAVQPRVCPPTCAGTPYAPTQLRTGFGLTTAPLTSLTGTGQTLGLLELDDFQQANINGYDTSYSLPPLTPQREVVDGGPVPAITNPGEIEVELDIEVMHALAPGASILVFEGPNSTTGVNDTYGCMVNPAANAACPNHAGGITAPSNSTSWGECEPNQGPAETNTLGAIFAQAAAQGQSFFAASGDTGAYDCYPDTSGIWVDSPASDPNVTGVGGTKLFLNPDNTYNSETAWPREPQLYYGSGGGKSIFSSKPSWQTGPGVITTAGAPRQVPDVSLNADPVTGYSVYTCLRNSGSCTASGAGLRSLGGTSAGAPGWAAFTAIYNQYAACQGRQNLGFANPTLYSLGSNAQPFPPFNDVTIGDNKEGTTLGYSAGAHYDMVTGWGSLRASDFAQDVAGQAGPPQLNTVTPATGSPAGGTAVTLTGCGFVGSSSVMIDGSIPATNVQFVSSTTLTATMPAHALGTASIRVVNPGSPPGNAINFTYAQPIAFAGAGFDGALWKQQGGTGWTSLGGILAAAPAVVSVPNGTVGAPLYIGLGADHDLWVRTNGLGWQPLDNSPVYCLDNPGAALVNATTLMVACQGGDHHLYRATGSVSAGVLPTFNRSSWTDLGGILVAGPAMATVPGHGSGPEIMVLGQDSVIYEYHSGAFHYNGFVCTGHPAIATDPAGTTAYFGCHAPSDGALYWSQNTGGAWSGAASLGGLLLDGPAVAVTNLGATFYVEGVDHMLYERGLSGGYQDDGGYIQYGVGAAALF